MGITGLLPLVKPCIQQIGLKRFKNKTIGVDGHSWLYNIGIAIAEELYYNKETDRHLSVLKSKLSEYLNQNIKLIFVFDGDPLPSKLETLEKRTNQKNEIKEKITILLKQGKKAKARFLMKQCISIKPFFLNSVIKFLRDKKIECIISPYETDAQLTHLQRIGFIDGILTEDSDFIIYGCTNILYKANGGRADLFTRERLKLLTNIKTEKLLEICILSGCDYLKNIKKVGLKTAIKLFNEHISIKEIIYYLRSKNFEVPEDYEKDLERALLTFKHQVVYDPIKKKRVFLSGEEKLENMEFLGCIKSNKENEENIELTEIITKSPEKSKYF